GSCRPIRGPARRSLPSRPASPAACPARPGPSKWPLHRRLPKDEALGRSTRGQRQLNDKPRPLVLTRPADCAAVIFSNPPCDDEAQPRAAWLVGGKRLKQPVLHGRRRSRAGIADFDLSALG